MKQLLALLLLACVLAVHGEKDVKKDPCTQPVAAVETFLQYTGCEDPDPFERIQNLMMSIEGNVTVHNLGYLFTNYCSTVMPSMVRCFERNIQNCTNAQQDSLLTVARQTGFVCEPNQNRTHPVMTHLLTQLAPADLADPNEECNNLVMIHVFEVCHNRSMDALGVSHANFSDYLESLNMEQLVTKIQTYYHTAINCSIAQFRENREGCPQWRGQALGVLRYYLFPTVLGNSMNFTTADVDQMFLWQSSSQTQTYEEHGNLLSWFR